MRIKREVLVLTVLSILFILFQIMTNIGGKLYDKEDLLQVISYFVPVWVGFFILKLKQNHLIWIFIILFSVMFGILEAYILTNPSDFIVRLVGWPIVTFIIMIWIKNKNRIECNEQSRKND